MSRLRSRLLLYLGAWRQSEAHKRRLHYEVTTTSATGRDHGPRLGRAGRRAARKQSHPTSSLLVLAVDCRRRGKQVWDGWMRENVERLGRLSAMRRRLSRSNVPNHANRLCHGNLVRRSLYLSLGRSVGVPSFLFSGDRTQYHSSSLPSLPFHSQAGGGLAT